MHFLNKTIFSDQSGQGLVEYALILILVSVAAIVIMGLFGTELAGVYNEVTNALSGA